MHTLSHREQGLPAKGMYLPFTGVSRHDSDALTATRTYAWQSSALPWHGRACVRAPAAHRQRAALQDRPRRAARRECIAAAAGDLDVRQQRRDSRGPGDGDAGGEAHHVHLKRPQHARPAANARGVRGRQAKGRPLRGCVLARWLRTRLLQRLRSGSGGEASRDRRRRRLCFLATHDRHRSSDARPAVLQ
jgi:hypothetical protein